MLPCTVKWKSDSSDCTWTFVSASPALGECFPPSSTNTLGTVNVIVDLATSFAMATFAMRSQPPPSVASRRAEEKSPNCGLLREA